MSHQFGMQKCFIGNYDNITEKHGIMRLLFNAFHLTYYTLFQVALISAIGNVRSAEVRLLDLEPADAQQLIEKQDQSLNYAPKIESNVPAVR